MIKKEIAEKINKGNYDFLNTNKDLKDTAYLVASGSFGYGTYNQNSDLDLRGFVIEQPEYLFGLEEFEQFENLQTDTVIYGMKKFVKLCIQSNPNTLELLGVREDCIVKITDEGKVMRDNAELFFSKQAAKSFGNYAIAQLRRLQNALARDSYPQAEKEKHILETINSQMHHFKTKYSYFKDGEIEIFTANSDKQDFDEEIFMNISLKNYPLRDFVNIYSEMSNVVKAYNKLNHRNKKKDEPHLYKHAMHLIRLLLTGIDLLDGKGIITYRKNEIDLLMDIRNGKHTFEEIYLMVDDYQSRFLESSKKTLLPDTAYTTEIEGLIMKIYGMKTHL